MRVALDTNRYSDLIEGDRVLAGFLETVDRILVPFVVLAELRGGFALGNRRVENERILTRFLASPGVAALHAGDETTHVYARLYRQLRRQGTPIPTNDMWIAALAVEHDLAICTRDDHFRHLPQVTVLPPI